MKKRLVILLCVILLAATCLSVASCGVSKSKLPIDFGKKYRLLTYSQEETDIYYVFESDHTGYYHVYDNRYPEFGCSSYQIDFVWREGNGNAVYLFETEKHRFEDHTRATIPDLRAGEFLFFDEYLVAAENGDNGATKYVKEGSKLEKDLKKAS